MNKVCYIAAPYTSNPEANVRKVMDVADELVKAGFVPYLPHLSHFWNLVSPKPYEFWLEYDLAILAKCDCVLRIPGESKGADGEVEFALRNWIPVYYSVEELVRSWSG